MPSLSIREYEHLASLSGGTLQVGQEPANASQSLAIAGASAASAAFGLRTKHVRVHCDVACSLDFGLSPVATLTSCALSEGQTEYFGVRPGDKVAVILIP